MSEDALDGRTILISEASLTIKTPESSDIVEWSELVDWMENSFGFALFHPMINEFTGYVPKRVFDNQADMDWFRSLLTAIPQTLIRSGRMHDMAMGRFF